LKLGLAGDTMLGRRVAEAIDEHGPDEVVADEVVAVVHEADLLVLNLECCISKRGERWPDRTSHSSSAPRRRRPRC
jgi:Bacterial capsule synthesis protein PGA_cap